MTEFRRASNPSGPSESKLSSSPALKRTTWLKMQNSLLPKEDAHPRTLFLNEELEEIFFKKEDVRVWIKVQLLQEPHTIPGVRQSKPPAKLLPLLSLKFTFMATTFLQGNCSSLKSTEIADDNKTSRVSPRAGGAGRAAASQPAHFGNGIPVPPPRAGKEPLFSPTQRRTCEHEIHFEHCSQS